MTDSTTRATWRAQAERWKHSRDWAPRVIALCDELEAIEDLPERQAHKITLAILMDTEAALAAAQGEIERLEKLAYMPNEHGGPSIETYQAEVATLREDAALLDGLGAIVPTMLKALTWGAFKGAIMEDSVFKKCMERWAALAQAKGEKS